MPIQNAVKFKNKIRLSLSNFVIHNITDGSSIVICHEKLSKTNTININGIFILIKYSFPNLWIKYVFI